MWDRERETAAAALLQAGLLARLIQDECLNADVLTKPDQSPVSIADFAIQVFVARILLRSFPDIPLVAEEDASFLRKKEHQPLLELVIRYLDRMDQSLKPLEVLDWLDKGRGVPTERFWTLDPIDGTKGFLRNGQFAIALALIHEGRVILGEMACPRLYLKDGDSRMMGCLYVAQVDAGCEVIDLQGHSRRPVRVKDTREPGQLQFVESYDSSHTDTRASLEIMKKMGIESLPSRVDGQPKYGLVAAGEADVYMRIPHPCHPGYQEKIWDHAAGAIAVQEAGGKVTDLDGRGLDFSKGVHLSANRGIVATNGWVHEQILDSIRHYFSLS